MEVEWLRDIITEIYYLVDEKLPMGPHDPAVERRLWDSLTPEQAALFEAYQEMEAAREESERQALFRFLVKLGLYLP